MDLSNDYQPLDFSSDDENIFDTDIEDSILGLEDNFLEESRTLPQDQVEPENLNISFLTKAATNPLTTLVIEDCLSLPEYPQTLNEGYTYRVNVRGTNAEQAMQIQYGTRQVHPPKNVTSVLLNARGKKHKMRCSGIKHCQYLRNTLRSLEHNKVSEETWNLIQKERAPLDKSDPDIRRRNANSLFLAAQKRFRNGNACSSQGENCALAIKQQKYSDIADVQHSFLTCTQATNETYLGHFRKPLPANDKYDIIYLTSLIDLGVIEPESTEQCGVIESNLCRRIDCGIDHPQGPGKLVHMDCEVTFHVFVPNDLEETPYIHFTSHGTHSHAPPPPNKPPMQILNEVLELVRRISNPDLTLGRFLRNPVLEQFCKQYKKASLAQIHASFATMDRISRLIQKEKLTLYPEGKGLARVEFEFDQRHRNPETAYIQHIYSDRNGIMIICFLQEQAKIFLAQRTFEVDMSFKRILEMNMNEIVFTVWLEEHGKIFTLARVITNTSTRRTYELCFERVFHLLSEHLRKRIRWKHIHGGEEGFEAVVSDMDGKQMAGFGGYLQHIDPQNREWTWHLKKTLVFRGIHFLQSISRAAGNHNEAFFVQERMKSLLTCKSQPEYEELCDLLIANESQPIANWAIHKRHPVIASGLNKHCSLVNHKLFDSLRHHTNAVEQTANKSYAFSVRQYLLPAILGARKIDRRDVDQYFAGNQYGISHTQRGISMLSRYADHMTREKRKRKEIQDELQRNDTDDDDNDILFQASSSGVVRTRSRSPRGSRTPRSRSVSPSRLSSVASDNSRNSGGRSRPLKRQALSINQDLEEQRQRLEIRKMELELEAKELENMEKRIQLERMKAGLR